MPRVKLYFTKAQKRAANRLKSNRSYQKHKAEICERRKATRRLQAAESHSSKGNRSNSGTNDSDDTPSTFRNIHRINNEINDDSQPGWLRRARRIEKKIEDILAEYGAKDYKEFLDAVYHKHRATRKRMPVDAEYGGTLILEVYNTFERIVGSTGRLFSLVYRAFGTQHEGYIRAKELDDRVRLEYCSNLSDMVCHDMVGIEELIDAWEKKKLSYRR
ncbi:hypothetical protein VNI00_017288 [Paramarasmius palmivorus]|uniref:Uncharacterized protein n=1 Tax=Paramarasmius palmivorus TaxID=297713 RepID=A0AAW0B8Y0_9AGAR